MVGNGRGEVRGGKGRTEKGGRDWEGREEEGREGKGNRPLQVKILATPLRHYASSTASGHIWSSRNPAMDPHTLKRIIGAMKNARIE